MDSLFKELFILRFSRFRRGVFEIFWLYVLFTHIFLIRGKLKGQRGLWKKISILEMANI